MCLKLCVPDQTIDIRPRKMSKFFRFFSRRRTGRGVKSDQTDHGHPLKKKNAVQCTVMLLDGTDFSTELHVSPMNIIYLALKWDIQETMAFIMFIFNMIYLTLQVNQSVDISSNIDYPVGIISVIFYQCKYLLVILYNNQFQFNMKFMIYVIESFSRMINLDLYLNDIANFLSCLLSPFSFI